MDAVVVDVGGTTTDVGLLVGGFPRQAGLLAEIGGVQTNYAIPDTVSVGLGGGSLLRTGSNAPGVADGIALGPDSVGHRLVTEALAFGGNTATSTDVAVVMGYAVSSSTPPLRTSLYKTHRVLSCSRASTTEAM